MKLGVAGIVSEWSKIDAAAAARVRGHGFRGVSVFFSKPQEADLAKVQQLKTILADAGLEAAQANGAYEALVNPDESLRAEGIRGLVRAGALRARAGCADRLCPPGRAQSARALVRAPG